MRTSPDEQARRVADTREAAAALVEDIKYFREIVARINPSPVEIRRASVLLRRLLTDRELAIVAAPRIGKVMLLEPDNKPFYKSSEKTPIPFSAVAVPWLLALGCEQQCSSKLGTHVC